MDEKYCDEVVADVLIRTEDSVITLPGGATNPDKDMSEAADVCTLVPSTCDDDTGAGAAEAEALLNLVSLETLALSFLDATRTKPLLLLNDLHPKYFMP